MARTTWIATLWLALLFFIVGDFLMAWPLATQKLTFPQYGFVCGLVTSTWLTWSALRRQIKARLDRQELEARTMTN